MKKIQNFTSKELRTNEANTIKGGVFCEVYIGYGNTNHGQMKKAMRLDAIAAAEGMAAALAAGGSQFLAKYGG